MKVQEFQQALFDLIESSRLERALKELKENLRTDIELWVYSLSLSREYNKLLDRYYSGLLSYSEMSISETRITEALIRLIGKISVGDLKDTPMVHPPQGIANPILVVSRNEEKDELSDFFQKLGFSSVSFGAGDLLKDQEDVDLVIFDNRDLQDCRTKDDLTKIPVEERQKIEQREEMMQSLIEKTPRLLLHYGGQSYIVSKNRNRVYAANSSFSLYARTKEIIDFINAYRV